MILNKKIYIFVIKYENFNNKKNIKTLFNAELALK